MSRKYRCASCGRTDADEPNSVKTVKHLGMMWCTSCAAVRTVGGKPYVSMPSPGRMYEGLEDGDALGAWEDCYEKKTKKSISSLKAKAEIQRAWDRWPEEKSNLDTAMFIFFGWLQRHRPYFLTFRRKGDPWQTVHGWLIEHEAKKKA